MVSARFYSDEWFFVCFRLVSEHEWGSATVVDDCVEASTASW